MNCYYRDRSLSHLKFFDNETKCLAFFSFNMAFSKLLVNDEGFGLRCSSCRQRVRPQVWWCVNSSRLGSSISIHANTAPPPLSAHTPPLTSSHLLSIIIVAGLHLSTNHIYIHKLNLPFVTRITFHCQRYNHVGESCHRRWPCCSFARNPPPTLCFNRRYRYHQGSAHRDPNSHRFSTFESPVHNMSTCHLPQGWQNAVA